MRTDDFPVSEFTVSCISVFFELTIARNESTLHNAEQIQVVWNKNNEGAIRWLSHSDCSFDLSLRGNSGE